MDRQRLDRWLEHGILSLVCIILIVAPFLFGATRLIDFAWVQGLTIVALILWMARFWVRDEYRVLWPPIAWTIVAFVGYVIWRYTTAEIEYFARHEMNQILVYAALFFLILDNFNKQEWTQILVYTLIFVGMAAAMYAVYQFATGSRTIYNIPQPASYAGRAGGPFVNPNHLADYIAMVTPMAFALVLMARINIVLKVFVGYAGMVMLAGAFTTLSRAGCAALGLGLMTMLGALLFNRDFRIKALIAIALILIPVSFVATKSIKAQYRMKKGFSETGAFADDRQYLFRAARSMWQENYWTGVGPGHYDTRFRFYRGPLAQLQVRPQFTHNDYLNTLADYGIIGFTLGMAVVGAFWLSVVKIGRYVRRGNDLGSRQSTRSAIVLGACAGLGALMVHCIVEFNLHIPALAIVAVTLLAIVTGHWRFATERLWFRPGIWGRLAATIVCAALAAWLGFNFVRTVGEQRLLVNVERIHDPEQYQAVLKRAYAIDPRNPETPYWIGSSLRYQSWKGAAGYEKLAREAIGWFEKANALNPYDPRGYIGIGMCLHWLDRHQEAWPYFRHAKVLDPYNYWVQATYGWHMMQFQAWWPAARALSMSRGLKPTDNPMAETYFKIVVRKLEEQNKPPEISKPDPTPPVQQTPEAPK